MLKLSTRPQKVQGLPLTTVRCPHCKSIEFRSVGIRNSFERAIYWLLQPYRCELCGHHFFLFRWRLPLPA